MSNFKYYAIMNKRTKKLIHGTNFDRNGAPVQIYVDEYRPPRLFDEYELKYEIKRRNINLNTFKIVRAYVVVCED